jgi:hypothetical protein
LRRTPRDTLGDFPRCKHESFLHESGEIRKLAPHEEAYPKEG